MPSSNTFDSILVGYYEGSDLRYAARIRNGFVPATRQRVFAKFRGLYIDECPFVNLPERGRGRWGEGLTAEVMKLCRWLKPRLVASIEFLEWTLEKAGFGIPNSFHSATTETPAKSSAKRFDARVGTQWRTGKKRRMMPATQLRPR